uniref:V-type proton ATPase subunit G n=1 Tax=Trieres chinensis TaxID=1514140 RepID=A0A6U1V8H8_TRICV|mmetsp:Transcript_2511/g.5383  ORF Transcript_2511/g.5383 Transcript_2511/m.5383 type:complete len:152 (+) Transcript_2511:46-501(+)
MTSHEEEMSQRTAEEAGAKEAAAVLGQSLLAAEEILDARAKRRAAAITEARRTAMKELKVAMEEEAWKKVERDSVEAEAEVEKQAAKQALDIRNSEKRAAELANKPVSHDGLEAIALTLLGSQVDKALQTDLGCGQPTSLGLKSVIKMIKS